LEKLKSLKVPLAGKTGTTNDNFDAWFIGFSSDLVIGNNTFDISGLQSGIYSVKIGLKTFKILKK